MRVDSLLNPAPTERQVGGVAVLERDSNRQQQQQAPYTGVCAAYTDSGRLAHLLGNDRDDFEMAVWRQESGLGPPPFSATARIATPVSADHHHHQGHSVGGGHGANASRQEYAEDMRKLLLLPPPPPLGPSPSYQHRPQENPIAAGGLRLQIFVARPPIVAHGAMSTDKSGDYIRPPPLGSEHLLGGEPVVGFAPPPLAGGVSSAASSPPYLSSSSTAAFSDAGSSTSSPAAAGTKFQTHNKRPRLHSDAAAAAAVLTLLSGRTVAHEAYEEEEDDEDDELDHYAEAFT
ncbi:hypothetical protein GGI21_004033, partial [Coemansia aciculifera]